MIVTKDTTVTVTLSLREAEALKRFIHRTARGASEYVGPVPVEKDVDTVHSLWEILDCHKIYMDGH